METQEQDTMSGQSARHKHGIFQPSTELGRIDGRTKLGRRFGTLIASLTEELGGNLTAAETALVNLTASVIIRVEQVQSGIITGHPIDDTELVRLTNTVSRLVREINAMKAKRKAAGPTALQAWLAARETEVETDEADDTAE